MNAPDKNGAPMRGEQSKPSAQGGDAIARSKRILALVDDYHDRPTNDTRSALRHALMDEFAPPPAGGGKEALSDAASDDEIHAIWTKVSGGDPDGWPVALEFALALRAGRKG